MTTATLLGVATPVTCDVGPLPLGFPALEAAPPLPPPHPATQIVPINITAHVLNMRFVIWTPEQFFDALHARAFARVSVCAAHRDGTAAGVRFSSAPNRRRLVTTAEFLVRVTDRADAWNAARYWHAHCASNRSQRAQERFRYWIYPQHAITCCRPRRVDIGEAERWRWN